MPDILIRGMEMPPLYRTYKVRFADAGDGKILVGIANEDSAAFRPIGEAIELPTHGDLIDRSEVLFDAGDVCEGCGDYAVFGYSCDQINSYKVIVPASEEKADHD